MTTHTYKVELQPDFLRRQAKAKPLQAIAELIWNSLDADASHVTVRLDRSGLGLSRIVIRDNGHGIPYEEAPHLFTRLGGSWKQIGGQTKTMGRMLHGYEGRGRFKVFAVGRVANWRVTYATPAGDLHGFGITMCGDEIGEVQISEEEALETGNPGVEISVSELHQDFKAFAPDNAVRNLSEIFALYLKNYRDVSILYEGINIDAEEAIITTEVERLQDIEDNGTIHSVELEVIQWRNATTRDLYLCTEQGFPLSRVNTRFRIGEFHFSAYLKSSFVTKLRNEAQLELAGMNPLLTACIDEAQQVIKARFHDLAAERACTIVEEWKSEHVYPYEGEPKSPLEDVERKVFDILAVTASDYLPDFIRAPRKRKAFDLRMLRTAIEKSPEELQVILKEVLDLPREKQEDLAQLLQEASLSSIISAAKVVADRLKFLAGLDQILFDPGMKANLKERSQLHKIIEDNTWLFGEEYNLAVSDKGLTAVLQKHLSILGDEVFVDRPVKLVGGNRGIVDLMLSKALRRHRADDLEYLIVELKRPSVKIGSAEIMQVEKYAMSVAKDERFRSLRGVKWTFWAISDEIDDYGTFRMSDRGVVLSKDEITIGIKTWGQILEENKARLQFFQERLEHQVDDESALKYLQDKYQGFLAGVTANDTTEEQI